MNLTPTSDARIYESQWSVDPKHPLIETKVFYAKLDNLLYYVTAHRGPTLDNLAASPNKVTSVMLADQNGMEDTSLDCFNMLVKELNTPRSHG